MRRIFGLSVLFVALSVSANAEMPKEGAYSYTACWSGTTDTSKFSGNVSLRKAEFTGVIHADTPGGPFDKETFHCIGIETTTDGKTSNGMTLCEASDKDGNKRLARFTTIDDKVTREQVMGSGKYEGIIITSSAVVPVGPLPQIKEGTIQACNHQKGTYKLK
jgi:hypothetical protein